MKFVAIDVETANANMASICSVGVAVFENGELAQEWYSLIDPRDYFDGMNVSIHGIDETQVVGAPTFAEITEQLGAMLSDNVVVTHTHFDRVAMHQAARHWSVPPVTCTWLDSARVARRTWEECAQRGYGLANVCKLIGHTFEHHNALEDAKASGVVLLAAMNKSGFDLDRWLTRVTQPIDPSSRDGRITRDGNPDGALAGEVVVFTGALEIPRREAADLAASIGCSVGASVTKKTTLLVVGDTDVARLAGHAKSSKHRKAEDLAAKGVPIRIIRETDFRELVEAAPI
ncbi:exonuclease domain-containing protein [Roseobacter litoralis]|uniref:Exonuclease-like protein n=1 Tax=Roseobacter litoralis (strain ATCC 49566 / DSM 6996 / JCM 21268 / NBRC 15278 / OCh 149) TaxID=391595 RepID=F7ZAQ0_ROSLO|nr:exonuclease domain-containing protein [Roseobacter litoralis]AEI94246.1 exonuclease-like protein [Roseobacter litoralis Och 149]